MLIRFGLVEEFFYVFKMIKKSFFWFLSPELTEEEVEQMERTLSKLDLVEKFRLCYVVTMKSVDDIIDKTLVQRHAYHSAE